MKRFLLFILLLYSVCAQAQSRYDSLNISMAKEFVTANLLPLPSSYMMFVICDYSMIVFTQDKHYHIYYYQRNFDFKKHANLITRH